MKRTAKATPQQGRLIHQHQRHVARSVRTPPRIGPSAPAIAQMPSQNPRKSERCLLMLAGDRYWTRHVPHAEQIGDDDVHHHDEPTTSDTLNGSPHDKHFHVYRKSTYQTPNHEECHCSEQDWLPAPSEHPLAWDRDHSPPSTYISENFAHIGAPAALPMRYAPPIQA